VALPLLLLGPILRRVEPRRVSVFVATSKPCAVHLSLYDGPTDAASPGTELAGADIRTTAFGNQFHATVVTAALNDLPLMGGHRYAYDIHLTPDGDSAKTLKDLGLLEDSELDGYGTALPASAKVEVCGLSYTDGALPSFVTVPDTLDALVLAHTSCRKPHGNAFPAMQHLDEYVDDLKGSDDGYPHMLFLTGDQIYADDVAAALLPGLNSLGISLLSGDGGDTAGVEQVPSPTTGGPFNVSTTVLPAGFRQKVTASAGFTSEDAPSHLIGFGEFLAMYCLNWNPQVWPVLAVCDTSDPGIESGLKALLQADAASSPDGAPVCLGRPSPDAATDVITPLYAGNDTAGAALAGARRAFLDEKALLDVFRREVPKVRRLMANVPTYMICDDHEVTDDWFMTGGIRAETTDNPFGRALLRNALAAYVVCQAWGDDPQAWATDQDHRDLLAAIAGMFGTGWSGGLALGAGSDRVDAILGLSPLGVPKFDFSFVIDGPVVRVRVLDTRTRRQYDTPASPPGLLTNDALDHQLPHEVLPDGHVLVVVSPCPAFGPPVMTEIGGPIAVSVYDLKSMARSETARSMERDLTGLPAGGRPSGMQAFDVEHWGANPAVYERFLARLSEQPRVVVLGGDVHYGGAFAMDWTSTTRTSRIVHFTCSAAHNGWVGVVRNLFMLNGMSTGLQHLGAPMTRLGWSATLPPVVDGLDLEPPLTRVRVQTGPVLLSDEMFRAAHPLQRPPDWLWRSDTVTDVRASADRPPAAQVPSALTEVAPGPDAVRSYGTLAGIHRQGLDKAAIARGLQFLDNLGVIRFSTTNGMRVSQSLYSLRARTDPNERGADYIEHETSLDPAPVAVPSSVGPVA
jgi:hypothetical protein